MSVFLTILDKTKLKSLSIQRLLCGKPKVFGLQLLLFPVIRISELTHVINSQLVIYIL